MGKGKGGVRPGLFNCVGLVSHQPTDENDTSLVTLCKGLETTNLETFCKYLRNAHSYRASQEQSEREEGWGCYAPVRKTVHRTLFRSAVQVRDGKATYSREALRVLRLFLFEDLLVV